MAYTKIIINKNTFIKYINRDDYELHIRACGPNGAWVYKFNRGNLKWRQRRSYAFMGRPHIPEWIDEKEP